ncbi:carboxymuconolactone decarboxylase family protein [Micromonosporaceae bacterium B7E4]
MSMPRIAPLPPSEWSERTRTILTADLGEASPLGVARLGDLNLFTTIARHSRLFPAWMRFGQALLADGSLPFADRELVILRVAHLCHVPYEWGHHARIALAGGLDRATVDRVVRGPTADDWDERSRLLLTAVDELHTASSVSTSTWSGLRRHLDTNQLIELPVLVGHYVLLAYTINTLEISPEPGLEGPPQ